MAFYEPRPNYYEPRESPVTTPRRQLRVLRPAVNPSRSAGTLLASPSESAFPQPRLDLAVALLVAKLAFFPR